MFPICGTYEFSGPFRFLETVILYRSKNPFMRLALG